MNVTAMKILSIDTNKEDLLTIEKYGRSLSLEIESFDDPQKALLSSKSTDYDVVLVNYEHCELNGLDFIKAFRHAHSEIPIIMLTHIDEVNLQAKALHLGAYDCLSKPINASLFQARVLNALELKKSRLLLKGQSFLLCSEIEDATKVFKDNEHEALGVIALCAEYKVDKAGAHALRIAHYCKLMAKEVGLNEKIQDLAFHSAPLYDIGKIGITDEILLKTSALSEDEYLRVKEHARLGYDILKYSQSGYLKAAAVISYSHHEKYDGSGYPIGLSGETIPILGRIMAIIDVFDALTQDKIYKKAWSVEKACSFLVEEKGKHFDPNFVDVFMQNLEEIKSIKEKFEHKK